MTVPYYTRSAVAAFFLSSLQANGSRECAPDDKLRETIHTFFAAVNCSLNP
jgi:hypothetical protein